MGPRRCWALALALASALLVSPAAVRAAPPNLDCELGYEGLRFYATALPGAETGHEGGFDFVTVSEPDRWIARIFITTPDHAAHPAVVQRTQRKQVTDVWTADSKGCGFGNSGQFTILMNDMKSGDTEMTNASRVEVEERKREKSPLTP
ncbi:hypothetical protein W911_11660 [Hyphomicrobium nitrativorans NL23]|uniref:Uncharacterized protein n=1 Tax=Hyphomicrobium nitrativorans NL23 TaxID=1029756 RepID=V5SEG3_9HYPH|nr:hypothetical protein [Hyphomicrobium nitrativorans]AHB48913.1 hypothetical protein W911_11660 [Hyphomicrobium nitrativorans NL23]